MLVCVEDQCLTQWLPSMTAPPEVDLRVFGHPAQSVSTYTSVDEIRALLKRQLLEPVQWEQGTRHLVKNLQCAQYVEAGPGKQLKAMMRRIDQDAWNKTITLEK